jgi:hypothetical protein
MQDSTVGHALYVGMHCIGARSGALLMLIENERFFWLI